MTGTVLAPFTALAAVALPYDPVNVDTDQIIPARFLKSPRAGGYGKFLFHDLRFADDGSQVPGRWTRQRTGRLPDLPERERGHRRLAGTGFTTTSTGPRRVKQPRSDGHHVLQRWTSGAS